VLILALCAASLVAYSNSFSSGFVFDNAGLLQDTRIQAVTPENIHLILTQEYWYKWSIAGLYRPFATFTYLFNYAILGGADQPAGYHWVNFLLHAANIALVYALGLVLFEEIAPAFALAALWSLHPILTESVTNIIGRTDLLAALGVLAGLLCHIRATATHGTRRLAWLLALMAATAVGLFSKESAVVVVAVMALYDLTFCKAAAWRDRLPGYLALIPPVAAFLYIRGQVLSKLPPFQARFTDNPLFGVGFWSARLTAIKVIGKYIGLLLWPRDLSCDYSYNQVPLFGGNFASWEDAKALIALVACAAVVAVAIRCYKAAKPVFFFIAFFFVTLVPTSNLLVLIGSVMAERFLYLPSIGFAGCLVMAIRAAYRRAAYRGTASGWPEPRVAVPVIFAAISLAFAARTFARNFDWQDDATLWSSGVRSAPASFKTHMCLAIAAGRRWESTFPVDRSLAGLDQSIAEIEQSLAILRPLPDSQKASAAYINAGAYYRQKGEALAVANPNSGPMFETESSGWYRKSVDVLLQAEKIETAAHVAGWAQLQLELGRSYMRLADFRRALEAFDRGRRRQLAPAYFLAMADAARGMGDPRQAVIRLMEGRIADPDYPKFAQDLAAMYQRLDPKGCAATLDPRCPAVHDDFCQASHNMVRLYHETGRESMAAQASRRAGEFGCPATR
jgi:tetratricopeptide (TPR) repeat protein